MIYPCRDGAAHVVCHQHKVVGVGLIGGSLLVTNYVDGRERRLKEADLPSSLTTGAVPAASQEIPVADWLFTQGRFKHLKNPESSSLIEAFQQQVDEQWAWLLEQENGSV